MFSNKKDPQRTQFSKCKQILTMQGIIMFQNIGDENKILKPILPKPGHKQKSGTRMALNFSIAKLEARTQHAFKIYSDEKSFAT